jgi:hypothetical protein
MKKLLTLLLSFAVSIALGQIRISYIFRDACNDSLLTTPYELFQPNNTKNYFSSGKDLILDSAGLYIFSMNIWRHDKNLQFTTNKFYQKGKTYIDTIYIPKFLPKRNALHERTIIYCFCNLKANGIVKDVYKNGVIRMEGNFLHGIPISDIKFYDINGNLVKKDIYKSGNYISTKFYQNKDNSEFF